MPRNNKLNTGIPFIIKAKLNTFHLLLPYKADSGQNNELTVLLEIWFCRQCSAELETG